MVKVRMKRFGWIRHLVTRLLLTLAIVAINEPLIDLNHMVYKNLYESTHGKFNGTIKVENGKLVIKGKSISIFQDQGPTNIKWVMLVLCYAVHWCLHYLREGQHSPEGWSQMCLHLC